MWLTFEGHLGDARLAGRFALFDLWRREVIALWGGAWRARVSARERRHAHHRPVGSERTKSFMAFGMSCLDFKLGFRMLIKYPGLTLVGGLGMTVAIAIGAGFFDAAAVVDRPLPLEEGDRIVAIENWDTEVNNQERQILHDFVTWRDELESVEELGAWTQIGRNLITPDGQAEPVAIAEMTASGFQLARVPPLLGRTLLEEDEREGAPPVIVIGYDVWRTRFTSDPDIVGRDVRLGNAVHTVVGVMPEGFAFPMFHGLWTPLQADASDYERRQGPGIFVFGRLAPGATLDGAQAELSTIGLRAAAAFPETHERLDPRIVPYTLQLFDDMMGWEIPFVHFLITTLLVVVCVNIAILVYARTATRRGEIAVRSALGASRRRIVGQLFVEALVLSAAAAAVGLVVARLALRQVDVLIEQLLFMPFWIDFGLSSGTVVYVLAITVLAALIVGVLPAVKATGHSVHAGLQRIGVGSSGMQLGRTWTVLIVAQVVRYGVAEPGFAAEEFLTASLVMDAETPPTEEAEAYRREFASRYADLQVELARRLEAEPGVSDVTLAMHVPGEEWTVWIEVDGVPTPTEARSYRVWLGSAGHQVRFNRVNVGFFDAFDVPILTGRRFDSGDLETTATAVIVNRTFVEQVLGDADALGRRIRYVGAGGEAARGRAVELGRWYEIVGVVSDFPIAMDPGVTDAKLYHPMVPGQVYPVSLALRVRGAAPATFAGRLREITAALDPTVRLDRILPLDEVLRQLQVVMRAVALAIVVVTLSVLLLSAGGIYALMSFTVTQRWREIGIRTALGAHPHRILGSIFSRALWQLAIGVVAGVLTLALFDGLTGGQIMGGKRAVLLPAVAAIIMAVGLLAAVGPARRGLRIQPSEALRADG